MGLRSLARKVFGGKNKKPHYTEAETRIRKVGKSEEPRTSPELKRTEFHEALPSRQVNNLVGEKAPEKPAAKKTATRNPFSDVRSGASSSASPRKPPSLPAPDFSDVRSGASLGKRPSSPSKNVEISAAGYRRLPSAALDKGESMSAAGGRDVLTPGATLEEQRMAAIRGGGRGSGIFREPSAGSRHAARSRTSGSMASSRYALPWSRR